VFDGKQALVRHLSTNLMYANVMTKAVQGKQFIDERDRLTNWFGQVSKYCVSLRLQARGVLEYCSRMWGISAQYRSSS
jgi:hypothetical protein